MARSMQPLSHSKLKEILSFYRICFEAVVEAERRPSVTSFRRNPDDPRRWDVYPDFDTEGGLPADASAEVVAAYKKWNLCEHFCLMLYAAVKKHLGKYSAKLYWVRHEVVPTFFLECEGKPLEPFGHAVLFVQTPVGESFIFDCTGEQFGWPASDWLSMNIARHIVNVEANWGDGAATMAELQEAIFASDKGYWRRAFGSFNIMWERFNWDEAAKEELAQVEKWVQETAGKLAKSAAVETWA